MNITELEKLEKTHVVPRVLVIYVTTNVLTLSWLCPQNNEIWKHVLRQAQVNLETPTVWPRDLMTTDEVHSFPHSFIHSLEEEEEFIASAKGRYGWGRHPYTQNTARICQRMNLAVANKLITDKSVQVVVPWEHHHSNDSSPQELSRSIFCLLFGQVARLISNEQWLPSNQPQ